MHQTCPNCGEAAASGDTFCHRCGWHLGGESRALVVTPTREIVPYKLDRALVLGSATTLVLSAAWLGARWLAPRVAGKVASRLAAFAATKQTEQRAVAPRAPERQDPDERVELLWVRHVIWWRR